MRIGLTCGRFDVVEISTTDRFDEVAVNKIFNLSWFRTHCFEIVSAQRYSLNEDRGKLEISRDSSTSLGMTKDATARRAWWNEA